MASIDQQTTENTENSENTEPTAPSKKGSRKRKSQRETTSPRKKRERPRLAETAEGLMDLTRVTLKDVIKHGGSYGKPMKPQPEKETPQEAVPPPPPPPSEETEPDTPAPATDVLAPQLRLDEKGNIVLDEESLLVTHSAPKPTHENYDVVFESHAMVNSFSFTNRKHTERWSVEDTAKFYTALQQYGSDFSLIAKLFPNRTRRHIRNKFKKEEKENRPKLDWALANRVPIGTCIQFMTL